MKNSIVTGFDKLQDLPPMVSVGLRNRLYVWGDFNGATVELVTRPNKDAPWFPYPNGSFTQDGVVEVDLPQGEEFTLQISVAAPTSLNAVFGGSNAPFSEAR